MLYFFINTVDTHLYTRDNLLSFIARSRLLPKAKAHVVFFFVLGPGLFPLFYVKLFVHVLGKMIGIL